MDRLSDQRTDRGDWTFAPARSAAVLQRNNPLRPARAYAPSYGTGVQQLPGAGPGKPLFQCTSRGGDSPLRVTYVTLAGASRRMRNRSCLAVAPSVVTQLSKNNPRRNPHRARQLAFGFLVTVKYQQLPSFSHAGTA